jgi:hypothetical protein
VQSNSLVAQDIVTSSDGGRYLDGPGVVVRDHVIVGVDSGNTRGASYTHAIDFEKLESGLVDSGAISAAVSKIVDDGAVM